MCKTSRNDHKNLTPWDVCLDLVCVVSVFINEPRPSWVLGEEHPAIWRWFDKYCVQHFLFLSDIIALFFLFACLFSSPCHCLTDFVAAILFWFHVSLMRCCEQQKTVQFTSVSLGKNRTVCEEYLMDCNHQLVLQFLHLYWSKWTVNTLILLLQMHLDIRKMAVFTCFGFYFSNWNAHYSGLISSKWRWHQYFSSHWYFPLILLLYWNLWFPYVQFCNDEIKKDPSPLSSFLISLFSYFSLSASFRFLNSWNHREVQGLRIVPRCYYKTSCEVLPFSLRLNMSAIIHSSLSLSARNVPTLFNDNEAVVSLVLKNLNLILAILIIFVPFPTFHLRPRCLRRHLRQDSIFT